MRDHCRVWMRVTKPTQDGCHLFRKALIARTKTDGSEKGRTGDSGYSIIMSGNDGSRVLHELCSGRSCLK